MKHLLAIFFAAWQTIVFSQSPVTLNPGQRLPQTARGKLLANGKTIRLSDYKGKLLILDFWNIHCSVCITSMPGLDSLQQQFKDQIKIISVTKNSAAEVNKLLSKPGRYQPKFDMIVGDTIINHLFPHTGDPMHVWVDKNGGIQYITHFFNTHEQSVRDFLAGKKPNLSRRWDFGIDIEKPLLSPENIKVLPASGTYSLFVKGLEEKTYSGFVKVFKDSSSGKPILIRTLATPLYELFAIAFMDSLFSAEMNQNSDLFDSRIVIASSDSLEFRSPSDDRNFDAWSRKYVFSYEARVTDPKRQNLMQLMRDDLNRYSEYMGSIEKRSRKCLVIKRTGSEIAKAVTTNEPLFNYPDDEHLVITNMPIKNSLYKLLLEGYYKGKDRTVIDETDYKLPVDMSLPGDLADISLLNKSLNPYGFSVSEEIRLVDVLVIRDRLQEK